MKPIRCSTTSERNAGARQLLELAGDALELRRIEPGGELVDQQEPRPRRQRAREVEHLLLRAIELGGGLIGEGGEIERSEQRVDAARRIAGAAVGQRDRDVLAHGEGEEGPRHLEGAIDTGMHQPVRGQAADRASFEQDGAGVGPVEAGDDVDAGGLAGAVRPDEAEDFAGADAEAQDVERAKAAKALHQAVHG